MHAYAYALRRRWWVCQRFLSFQATGLARRPTGAAVRCGRWRAGKRARVDVSAERTGSRVCRRRSNDGSRRQVSSRDACRAHRSGWSASACREPPTAWRRAVWLLLAAAWSLALAPPARTRPQHSPGANSSSAAALAACCSTGSLALEPANGHGANHCRKFEALAMPPLLCAKPPANHSTQSPRPAAANASRRRL